ncbi:hypothetical protein OHZ10_30100 [Burkholderia arboris]|uniref:Uncharacterized protein n=1 Tax=Burkholderia arboris TaxID=488730 RepID=A0ABZ3DPR4_9BURK|nr:hypothetical protein [Burkholderia arboris]MCA8490959.1 hypothetical protein [Burkholderia arboris]
MILSGFRVYICFNYYAGNGRDDNIFRRVIVSVFSRMNQIRFDNRGARVPAAHRRPLRMALALRAGRIDSRSFSHGSLVAYVAKRGSSVESGFPPGLRGGALLKFETPVHLAVRQGSTGRIRPSNRGIASRRSMIGARAQSLSRYIPETKNDVSGGMTRRGGDLPLAMRDGTTCGTPLAVMAASASGRHDATKMWGRPTRQ